MFLVTEGMYGLEENSYEAVVDQWELLSLIDESVSHLQDGECIQIRRADYLDTKVSDEVVSDRPKLTLLQGGKH